jgi:hypothetical protein
MEQCASELNHATAVLNSCCIFSRGHKKERRQGLQQHCINHRRPAPEGTHSAQWDCCQEDCAAVEPLLADET